MLGLKSQMTLAAVAAVLLGLLLLGVSYYLTPETPNQDSLPMPVPSTAHQIFMGILWTGLAATIALAAVAIGVLTNRMRNKKRLKILKHK